MLVLCAAVSACKPQRPDLAGWQESWEAVRAEVPEAATLTEPDAHAACEDLLLASRRARKELLPSPDPAMDATVGEWIDAAGALGFDCPGEFERIRSGLGQLGVLGAEVDASLALLRDDPDARARDERTS